MLELDVYKNSCVRQVISYVNPGKYKLSITYVARDKVPLADNSFHV